MFLSQLSFSEMKVGRAHWAATLPQGALPGSGAFCSVLGFLGESLIQVMTNPWTLLHSSISQTAARGDKTAGNAAL